MHLATVDLRTRSAKCAQEYMGVKGYPHIRPLGVYPIPDGECWYYYYHLPEGLLELEVFIDESGDFKRRVTAFVTDQARVRDLLSS